MKAETPAQEPGPEAAPFTTRSWCLKLRSETSIYLRRNQSCKIRKKKKKKSMLLTYLQAVMSSIVVVLSLSHVFCNPMDLAHQASLSIGFPRKYAEVVATAFS